MNIKFEHLYNYTTFIESDVILSDIHKDSLHIFNDALYITKINKLLNFVNNTYHISNFSIDIDNNKILFHSKIDKLIDKKNYGKEISNNYISIFKQNIIDYVNTLVDFVFNELKNKMQLKKCYIKKK